MKNIISLLYVWLFVLVSCSVDKNLNSNTDDHNNFYNGSSDSRGEDSDFERKTFPRQMEDLGRGLIATGIDENSVYLSWRMTGFDPENIAFNIYRTREDVTVKINKVPVIDTTDYIDSEGTADSLYFIKSVVDEEEKDSSSAVSVVKEEYRSIRLQGEYVFDKIAVGDLDGDGEYDFVIKQPGQATDPGVWNMPTDTFKLEAYRSNGEFMWRRDLGWNIVQGIWWSPILVYDLDGDGKAEVVAKTAPLDEDYREENGNVLSGPEWFSIFDGETGEESARENWIARGNLGDWGDDYGNRVNRNKLSVAYLDGKTPSLIVQRGIYRMMKMEAWNFRNGQLTRLWEWSYDRGGGAQNTRIGDIDNDGFDEIINGSIAVDRDGKTIWITGESHSDRVHLADIDPNRLGLEIWYCQEWGYQHPFHLRDASTGTLIWGYSGYLGDNGRAVVADIDESNPGMEMWSQVSGALFSVNGENLGPKPESGHWAVWWDGDLLRETVENGVITKYNAQTGITDRIGTTLEQRYSERFVGDILGDWREELIYVVPGEMRIYSTVIPSNHRFRTLMHDPLYRNDIAGISSGWPQYGNLSFFLGVDMDAPPNPNIVR